MGASNYSVYTKFKASDKVSPAINSMSNSALRFQRRMDATKTRTQRAISGMSNSFGKLRAAVGLAVGFLAANQIKGWWESATKAAEVELSAQAKLTGVLKNNAAIRARGANEYLKVSNSLFETASKMQTKGVIGDESIVAGMQALGAMGFDDKVIKKIIPVVADLAVQQKGYNVTASDTEQISKQLGRALAGNVGGLSRMGVVLSAAEQKQLKNLTAAQRANYIYDILSKRVGGLNEQFAKTDQGIKVQTLNNLSDRLEDIGKRLIPIEAGFFRVLNAQMPTITTAIDKFFNGFEYGLRVTQPLFNKFAEFFKVVWKNFKPLMSDIMPFAKNYFETFLIPKTIALIGLLEKIVPVVKFIFQYVVIPLLKATLSTIAFLINHWKALAIAVALLFPEVSALVGIVVLLWKNWDIVTSAVSSFWERCKTVFTLVGTFIKENFVNILYDALGFISKIIEGIINIGRGILSLKNGGGIQIQGANGQSLQNNTSPRIQNASQRGRIDVGVSINNSTAFPATSSLSLTGSNNLNLVPSY